METLNPKAKLKKGAKPFKFLELLFKGSTAPSSPFCAILRSSSLSGLAPPGPFRWSPWKSDPSFKFEIDVRRIIEQWHRLSARGPIKTLLVRTNLTHTALLVALLKCGKEYYLTGYLALFVFCDQILEPEELPEVLEALKVDFDKIESEDINI